MVAGRTPRAEHTLAAEGRINARPVAVATSERPGVHSLGLASGRDGLLYVPAGVRVEQPAPLALMLHGAGSNARQGLSLLRACADAAGLVLLAPESRDQTWDMLLGCYGADVAFVDEALAHVFQRCTVDPERIAIGGFSDGGSYALSLGLGNGDLFTHVLAFSPGFMAPPGQVGTPRVFISHGTDDEVLPVACSRRIVPQLQRAGYQVRYEEFEGPHTVPEQIAEEAVSWFCNGSE